LAPAAKNETVCDIMALAMTSGSKRLLLALVLVGGVLVAAYAAAPTLLTFIVTRQLDSVVHIEDLEIDSVGLRRTGIALLRVNNKQMRFEAQRGVVHYDLWPFEVRAVEIDAAELNIDDTAIGNGGGAPLPVTVPLSINSFSFRAATPWGEVAIPDMSITSQPGAAGGLRAGIESNEFTVEVTNPDRYRHHIVLRDRQGDLLLSLNADNSGERSAVLLGGRLEPQAAARWGRESRLLPAELTGALSRYAVESAGLEFGGILDEETFSVEAEGGVLIRDTRPVPERGFEFVRFDAAPGYTVVRSDDAWSGSGDAELELSLGEGVTLTGRRPGWRWNGAVLSFSAAQLRLPSLGFDASAVSLNASGLPGPEMHGTVSIEGAGAGWWPEDLTRYWITGRWTSGRDTMHAEGAATGNALPTLSWTLTTGPEGGSVEVNTEATLPDLEPGLRLYARPMARELDVLHGLVAGRYQYQWEAERDRTALEMTAGSMDANIDEMEIRGLAVKLGNRGDTLDRLDFTAAAPTLKLAAGAVAENLNLRVQWSPPELVIDEARLTLLGGDIAVQPIALDLGDERFEFFADIDALSLERVMSLLELETTELTGEVSGPVRVIYSKDGGIEINKGSLHSLRPGVLRLRLGPETTMAAQLDNIALRALRDFRYDELNADVTYMPDGEYLITARVVGSNPDVLDGHLIALNPSIQGRLPALFRAFFLTGDFSRAIIERLREEQSLSTPGKTSTLQRD